MIDQKRFQTAANVILQDVRPDISQLQIFIQKLTQFRKDNYKKYQEMYIDLSLPQLIEPFILLDLLPTFFDLLQDNSQTVSNFINYLHLFIIIYFFIFFLIFHFLC